jgi:hypothetical protein
MTDKADALMTVSTDALRFENDVIDRLTSRAEKYLTAIGVIAAVHIAEFDRLSFSGASPIRAIASFVAVIGLLLLGLALVFTLLGLRPRTYATYPDTKELQLLEPSGVGEASVKMSVAKLNLELRDLIATVNQERASWIAKAGLLITIGFVFCAFAQIGLRLTKD